MSSLLRGAALAVWLGALASAQVPELGRLLVATPRLRDPELAKSVVLLIYSNRDAAIGVVIDRPLGTTLAEVMPEARIGSEPIWGGGPVPLGLVALLDATSPQARQLLPGVFLLSDRARIAKLGPGPKIRILRGSCGWTGRQLQSELKAGDWRVLPGRSDIVFDPDPKTLWKRLQ